MASSSGAKPPAAAVPITAKRMRDLLTSMGADEYEPRVLHQLLEFMNSYATDMLQDAALYAEHAGHPGEIEVADVELARLGAAVVARVVVVFHQFAADHRRRAACREGGAG